MHRNIELFVVALLVSVAAHATDEALSSAEFDHVIAKPYKATHAKNGTVVELQLMPDGSASVRQGYNDVGTWHRDGEASYCVRWKRYRTYNRCSTLIKRDGKFALLTAGGDLAWWVEPAKP